MKERNSQKLLFQEFSPVSTEEWESIILNDLKGADYAKKLIWHSVEGIAVKPYYRSEDLNKLDQAPISQAAVRQSKDYHKVNSWLIRQDIDFETTDATSSKVEWMVSRGVESVGILFSSQPDSDTLEALLMKLPLESVEFNFSGIHPGEFLDALGRVIKRQGIDPLKVKGSLGCDPISDLMLSGKAKLFDEVMDHIPTWMLALKSYPNLKLIEVNGIHLRHAGCSLIQELGYVLAAGVEYIDQLSDRNLKVEDVVNQMTLNLAVGSNFFFELAKFRAIRSLWKEVVKKAGVEGEGYAVTVHAASSLWNKSIYDPHVNLLRTTTEAMSAILGGADSLCITPFNAIYQSSTEFSERLARNQQLLLREEAYLDKVIDPAGGSYYIETLTEEIKQESWKIFQSVEKEGGMRQAFLKGIIQDAIVRIAEQRDQRLASRKDILLGTNQYPNSAELMGDSLIMDKAFPAVPDPTGADAQPIIPYRGAEGFEKLRLQTEKSDNRPKVFLLPIGHPAMRKARATFAGNFFGCAGYEIIDNLGFSSLDEGLKKAHEAEADIIVLCSSDEEYAVLGPEAATKIVDAELVIAGNPVDHLEELERAGIRHFIHVRTNVLESLQGFNELLGINQ